MDQSATLTAAPPRPRIRWETKFTLHDLLGLYDAGKGFLTPKNFERWRETFALAASLNGVFTGSIEQNVGMLAVYWRTDNPSVDPNLRPPSPVVDGHYAYVCWCWNSFGKKGLLALRSHLARSLPGIRYLAHHDQRERVKGQKRSRAERNRGNGSLIVRPLRFMSDPALERLLIERNGHGK